MYGINLFIVSYFASKRNFRQIFDSEFVAKRIKHNDSTTSEKFVSTIQSNEQSHKEESASSNQLSTPDCTNSLLETNSSLDSFIEPDNYIELEGYDRETTNEFLKFLLENQHNIQVLENFQKQIDIFTKNQLDEQNKEPDPDSLNLANEKNEDLVEQFVTTTIDIDFLNDSISKMRGRFEIEVVSSFYNLNAQKISFIKDLDNEFGIYEYLNNFLTKSQKNYIDSAIKELIEENKKINFSFKFIKDPNVLRLEQNRGFKIFSYNILNILEEKYLLRLINLFNFVYPNGMHFLYVQHDLNINFDFSNKFLNFYNSYIRNSFILAFFEIMLVIPFNSDDLQNLIPYLIGLFNKFYIRYTQTVKQIFSNKYEKYMRKINSIFISDNIEVKRINLLAWIIHLLNNKTNSLLLILIPELKDLIEIVMVNNCALIHYKRFHFFFSLLVLKLNFNLPRIKFEFDKIKNIENFKLTDSKFINLFVLETRCFAFSFSVFALYGENTLKLLLFKCFISFVRCLNPELLKYFLFDEYTSFKNFNDKFKQITIELKNVKFFSIKEDNILSEEVKFDLVSISNKLLSLKYLKYTEEEKLLDSFNLFMADEASFSEFKSKNTALIKKITDKFQEYFLEFN